MKKTLITVVLSTILLAAAASAQSGWVSRYWDGCKPSCSWSNKQQFTGSGPCKECRRDNTLFSPTSDGNRSSCDGGASYTCWDMVPFRDPNDANKAYAFAATPFDQCGKCYEITFDGGFRHGNANATHQAIRGKVLVVMASNMGGDVGQGQFDVLVPGGGTGNFDSFSAQIGVSSSSLGERYGGLLSTCERELSYNSSQYQTCLKNKCNQVFGASNLAWLKAGCDFYADWFMAANNPTMTYKEVACPQILSERYRNAAPGTPGGGGGGTTPTTYTLTVNRNPGTNAGTVTVNGTQYTSPTTHNSGASVILAAQPANGYTFVNWTAGAGATISNVNSATTNATITGNATVTANFQQNVVQPATYTLTVNANPTAGGSVARNPNNSASQPAGTYTAGTQVTVTATTNQNYSFVNWTGSNVSNPNNTSVTVTMNSNMTLTANFQQTGTPPPTTYTLTLNRNPAAGGTVSVNGANVTSATTHNAGTTVNIAAQAMSGYTFQNWTGGQVANANSANTTVTMNSNMTLTANFQQGGTVPPSGRTDTIKVEAENFVGKEGREDQVRISTNGNGITNIGWIDPGNSTTYNVTARAAGAFTFQSMIATDLSQSTFAVVANGREFGKVSTANTGGWDAYRIVALGPDVQLNQGQNTIQLKFESAVNVDYFLLLGAPPQVAVRHNTVRAAQTASGHVTVRPAAGGFTALLPAGHAYVSYKLIDLRGREIRSSQVGAGVTDLRFSNLKPGVMFLRLEGRDNASTVLKAVTY